MTVRFEEYFNRWDSKLILVSPKAPSGLPRYMHKGCQGLIPVPSDRVPPKVCPLCGSDTVKEQREVEAYNRQGAILLDKPEKIIGGNTIGKKFKSEPLINNDN